MVGQPGTDAADDQRSATVSARRRICGVAAS